MFKKLKVQRFGKFEWLLKIHKIEQFIFLGITLLIGKIYMNNRIKG